MSVDRRRPPSVTQIERDRQQWLLDLHQRRQPRPSQRDAVVGRTDGWRSKVLCYVPDQVEVSHTEGTTAYSGSVPLWEFSLDFQAECAMFVMVDCTLRWDTEDVPELAKVRWTLTWDVESLDPGEATVIAYDTRLVWPNAALSTSVEKVCLPINGAFILPAGEHSIRFDYTAEHLNKEPATPDTYEHVTAVDLYGVLVAVEDRAAGDGPDCFIVSGEGGGEG